MYSARHGNTHHFEAADVEHATVDSICQRPRVREPVKNERHRQGDCKKHEYHADHDRYFTTLAAVAARVFHVRQRVVKFTLAAQRAHRSSAAQGHTARVDARLPLEARARVAFAPAAVCRIIARVSVARKQSNE